MATRHAASSVEAKSISIGSLIQDRYPFSVPRYQRGYAWRDDSVADFCDDWLRLMKSSPTTEGHFFGGIVSIEKTDHSRTRSHSHELVDGQQRLATVMLTLSCLHELAVELSSQASNAPKSKASADTLASYISDHLLHWEDTNVAAGTNDIEPRLRLSVADDPVFQQLLEGGDPTSSRESHELLIEARRQLMNTVRAYVGDTERIDRRIARASRALEALTADSYVIHIVSEDRQQAYRLFSVLNDRGESLSDADLLRSRSLELLEGFQAEQEEVAQLWDEMLGSPAKLVDAFLRAYLPSTTGTRTSGELFDAIASQFYPEAPTASVGDARKLRTTIQSFRDELQVYAMLSTGEWPYPRQPGPVWNGRAWYIDRLKRLVVTLKHELALPLLLATARCLQEKEFAALVHSVEKFAFRYKNICNGHASAPATVYYDVAARVRVDPTQFKLPGLNKRLRALIDKSAQDSLFREMLSEKLKYSNSSQRANIREFLTTIEDHYFWLKSNPQPNAHPKPSVSKVCDIDEASLEHIYPQNPAPQDVDPGLAPYTNLIGNLTFFSSTDNVAASNKSFKDKKTNNYAHSAVQMTADLSKLNAWTAVELEKRENELLDAALRVFVI